MLKLFYRLIPQIPNIYTGSISQMPNMGVTLQSVPYHSPFTMLVPTAMNVHCWPLAGTPLYQLVNFGESASKSRMEGSVSTQEYTPRFLVKLAFRPKVNFSK